MKNYDDQLTELWYSFLEFIFTTKVGHMIFNIVIAMAVMGLISLLFTPERRIYMLVGAFVGSFGMSLYYAWKDENETWL